MIVLITDDGWTLATDAWSLGGDPALPDKTLLSYFWGQKGTAQAWNVTLYKPVQDVLDLLSDTAAEGICDLRSLQIAPA